MKLCNHLKRGNARRKWTRKHRPHPCRGESRMASLHAASRLKPSGDGAMKSGVRMKIVAGFDRQVAWRAA